MSKDKRNERAEWAGTVQRFLKAAGWDMGVAQGEEAAEVIDETYERDFDPQEAAFYVAEVLA